MASKLNRRERVRKRHYRLRRHLSGTTEQPRLAIFRSSKHIYAQLIDDSIGKTLASASTVDKEVRANIKSTSNMDAAKEVGTLIASRAQTAGVKTIVFDRGGNLYHGRVAALADAAREAGLKF